MLQPGIDNDGHRAPSQRTPDGQAPLLEHDYLGGVTCVIGKLVDDVEQPGADDAGSDAVLTIFVPPVVVAVKEMEDAIRRVAPLDTYSTTREQPCLVLDET